MSRSQVAITEPGSRLEGARVLVLGWAGSTPRQLRSTRALYAREGAAAFARAPRVLRNMARGDGWAIEGAELAIELRSREVRDPRPLLVHSFSNAGFWSFAAFLRTLDRPPPIAGLVLDSAPGYPDRPGIAWTARKSAMAMMPMLLRALGRPPALHDPWLDLPLTLFMRLWFETHRDQLARARDDLELVASVGDWPILCLYGPGDALVPAEHVEAFVERAKERGREVRGERFEGSAHVQHLLAHRARYLDATLSFAAAALEATRAQPASTAAAEVGDA